MDGDEAFRVHETYVNALHHDTAVLPSDAWCVGVVNIPMYGIGSVTERNFDSLGPPDDLFDAFRAKRDALEDDDRSKTEAHNDAWDAVSFEETYRDFLAQEWEIADSPVREACETILDAVADRPVALVCYEGEEKNCHRHVLQSFLNSKRTEDTHHE